MRVFIIVAIFAVAAAGSANGAAISDTDYTPWFRDDAKIKSSIECLLDKAPCGDLQPLRDEFPLLAVDDCGGCTPAHKARYDGVKKTLLERFPEYHKALFAKYKGQ